MSKEWGFMKRFRYFMAAVMFVSLLVSSSIAMAYYDATPKILSKLQGAWYDADGNVVLNFDGDTVNGCKVVGAYHPAGGSSDFSCTLRIVEAGGYRDLHLDCEHLESDSYHAHVVLNFSYDDPSKGTFLLKTKEPRFYESVGGIGIDMLPSQVTFMYGAPDSIVPEKTANGCVFGEKWMYRKLGLQVEMRFGRVAAIRIFKYGDRHFDRTGFNCANAPYEFQEMYKFYKCPTAGSEGAFPVGHSEYMWFDDYPNSIVLNSYWN